MKCSSTVIHLYIYLCSNWYHHHHHYHHWSVSIVAFGLLPEVTHVDGCYGRRKHASKWKTYSITRTCMRVGGWIWPESCTISFAHWRQPVVAEICTRMMCMYRLHVLNRHESHNNCKSSNMVSSRDIHVMVKPMMKVIIYRRVTTIIFTLAMITVAIRTSSMMIMKMQWILSFINKTN